MAPARFAPDADGYVRHWLVSGPERTPYKGPAKPERELLRNVLDLSVPAPPGEISLGAPGPAGRKWTYLPPGHNVFVEMSRFYETLHVLDAWAATDLVSPDARTVRCRLGTRGSADLWANGEHVARLAPATRHGNPHTDVDVSLRKGPNRLVIRFQSLGVRDTVYYFGLRVTAGAEGLSVVLPGAAEATDRIARMERWLESVRAEPSGKLLAPAPPPGEVRLSLDGAATPWPAGTARVDASDRAPFRIRLAASPAGTSLGRSLEIPANNPVRFAEPLPTGEHRARYMEALERRGMNRKYTAIRLLGPGRPEKGSEGETRLVDRACAVLEERMDCADFTLAILLRLYALDRLGKASRERVRRSVAGFRYWLDETGVDGMCFNSENHALLFHSGQAIAGSLFPDDRFVAAGRTGAEQRQVGLERCRAWLAAREADGFGEFLSSSYMPITQVALMNLVDFAAADGVRDSAKRLVDRMFRLAALHAFDGVITGPQGRVYRSVIYPHESGYQAMLHYATPRAAAARTWWVAFVATSPSYRLPQNIETRMAAPASEVYQEANARITVAKTRRFMLSSVAIPGPDRTRSGRPADAFRPGEPGYQQHLWHATLGRDVHVFVNHPGEPYDGGSARPGFWYGNGTLPRLCQDGPVLAAIYSIPDDHPVGFTHAYWPADAFDEADRDAHWAFGRKGSGYVALWSSRPTRVESDVVSGRELRARGRRAAWLCLLSNADDHPTLKAFAGACRALDPVFGADARRLAWKGHAPVNWDDEAVPVGRHPKKRNRGR